MSETALATTESGGTNGAGHAPPPQQLQPLFEGFDGLAVAAFAPEVRAVLHRPVDPEEVEVKPDGIVYLPGIFYRRTLMEAFGAGGWGIAPRGPARRGPAQGGELVMYHGALICLGRYVSEAVGQCVYWPNNAGMTYADAFEGAKTDCITRTCKDLGIARELWDPAWREQWLAKYARKVKKRAQIWNPETRKKEWGEKEVWERAKHVQKLPNGAPAGQTGAAPSGSASAPPAPEGSSASGAASDAVDESQRREMVTKSSHGHDRAEAAGEIVDGATTDTGEAASEEELRDLADLVRRLKWRKNFAENWFKSRFGVAWQSITKRQLETATYLLTAFGESGPSDRYEPALEKMRAEGRCK